MRRSGSVLVSLVATAALLAAAAFARDGAGGPPAGAALAPLSQLPGQTALASQRIYFVLPDRYANGSTANDTGGLTGPRTITGFDPADPAFFHGGDLAGLAADLQRIKDLGFTALWLTPVLKNDPFENGSAAYHGYWGLDFTTVDPHLGSEADFEALVAKAHSLGLQVYLDVVVNHTADVVQLTGGSYTDIPFRDCRGRPFDPARFVARAFPCLTPANMPRVPFLDARDRRLKKPEWLNDPLNYHDRGNIDFGSCSLTCFEQGDFFGLDDLFTEKPNVMAGLAEIYASWIRRFRVDGFRVDTAKHVNAAFFRLWVPKIRAAARSAGRADFPIFGEVTLNDAIDLADYVRNRGLPQLLDFPLQQRVVAYASGAVSARGVATRLQDDDYFRISNGIEPSFTTFLGNHDMGRAAEQIREQAPGLAGDALASRLLLGYDLLYLLRGAPAVLYGDEFGLIGTGGDQQARQDLFPTSVAEWQKQERVGAPPIGRGSSFDTPQGPVATHLRALGELRAAHPELATGASEVLYAKGPVLVVARTDWRTRRAAVVAFNSGSAPATISVATRSGSWRWSRAWGGGAVQGNLTLTIPPVSALVAVPDTAVPERPADLPALVAGPDSLTAFYELGARVQGGAASVTFAVRRSAGPWRRVAVDDSVPYRAFLDPARFRRRERVDVVVVARGTDGSTTVSAVRRVTPRP